MRVRRALATARPRGEPFPEAWASALELVARGRVSVRGVPDADAEWRAAVEDARDAFRRAYLGEPPTPAGVPD